MSSIHPSAIVYDGVDLADNVSVEEFSVLGKGRQDKPMETTELHKGCQVGTHATIYAGSTIESDSKIKDYALIGWDSIIGSKSRIIYGSQIYSRVEIGNRCIVGGFLCNDSTVGDRSRIFGAVIHRHDEPHLQWGSVDEPSPKIQNDVFAGFGSKIIGDITIESQSFICSGAIVTQDIPKKSIVYGVNEIASYTEFDGKLSKSKFFK